MKTTIVSELQLEQPEMERFMEILRRAGEDSDSEGEERHLLGSGEEGK